MNARITADHITQFYRKNFAQVGNSTSFVA